MKVHHDDLPLKGSITSIYAFSFLIVILMTIVSIAGILCSANVYRTVGLITSFVPNDVGNLFIGLPILMGSMW